MGEPARDSSTAERLTHYQDVAGSTPAPATNTRSREFDGVRRWKNGKVARSQAGRDKSPRDLQLEVKGADAKVRVDLRRKEFRHLRTQLVRDWKGALVRPGETSPEFAWSYKKWSHRKKWKQRRPDGTTIMPTMGRAHLQRDGIYVKTGKPVGRPVTGRHSGRVAARALLRTGQWIEMCNHVTALGISKQRFIELAIEAFCRALDSSQAARKALRNGERSRA